MRDHPRFGFVGPRYMNVSPGGLPGVADQNTHRILLINRTAPADGGALVGVLCNGAPRLDPNTFDDPEGLAFDGARYFIADSDNNRIVVKWWC